MAPAALRSGGLLQASILEMEGDCASVDTERYTLQCWLMYDWSELGLPDEYAYQNHTYSYQVRELIRHTRVSSIKLLLNPILGVTTVFLSNFCPRYSTLTRATQRRAVYPGSRFRVNSSITTESQQQELGTADDVTPTIRKQGTRMLLDSGSFLYVCSPESQPGSGLQTSGFVPSFLYIQYTHSRDRYERVTASARPSYIIYWAQCKTKLNQTNSRTSFNVCIWPITPESV